MRVDFYQLGSTPLEVVIGTIAARLLERDERLLVIAADEALLARLDRLLWEQGGVTGYIAHKMAGGSDDLRQPVLLSTTPDAANMARNLLIADGEWRESALSFDRSFYLFDHSTLDPARQTWKRLATTPDIERKFWKQDDRGRWSEMG